MRAVFSITILIIVQSVFTYQQTHSQQNRTTSKTCGVEEVFCKRREKLEKQCLLYPQSHKISRLTLKNIICNREKNIAWCPIYKGGSTQWMWHMAYMSKYFNPDIWKLYRKKMNISKYVKLLYSVGNRYKYKDIERATKIIVVRHPFERLLSAYRDKLEKPAKRYYYEIYGRHISATYTKAFGEQNLLRRPTFTQFLKFIVNERNFNEHWRPYSMECDPCSMHYDFILKTESIDSEQKYLFHLLGITGFPKKFQGYKENFKNKNPDGQTGLEVSQKYFSYVSRILLQAVYKVYETDFLLFDYSPDWYYNVTNS